MKSIEFRINSFSWPKWNATNLLLKHCLGILNTVRHLSHPDPGIRQAIAIWIDATKEKQCAIHVVHQSLAGWWPDRKQMNRNYSTNHSTEYSNPVASITLSWPKA